MKLFKLATTAKLVEAQLIVAMREGASTRVQAGLLRRAAALMEQIENYQPVDQQELRDLVGFFVRRASSLQRPGEGQRELDIAMALTNRYRAAQLPKRQPSPGGGFEPGRPLTSVLDPPDLADVIAASPDRMALIGSDYRYLAVSAANAAFHRTTQIGMIDLHLADVIGISRFQLRARQHVDACFAGEIQDYGYELDTPRHARSRIRCRMMPIRDRRGRLYCVAICLTRAAPPKSESNGMSNSAPA